MKAKDKTIERWQTCLMFLAGSLVIPVLIAIVGGVFGLTQSFVGLIPWISQNSSKNITWNAFFLTPYTAFYFDVDGKKIDIKPPLCKKPTILELKDPNFIDSVNKLEFQNILVTQKTGTISYVVLSLDKYTPPPDYKRFDQIYFFTPPGMAGIPTVVFPETTISPDTTVIEIWLKDDFIKLDPGDAVRIYLPLNFAKPGTYRFHVELPFGIDEGKTLRYVAASSEFSWLELNSVSGFKLIDALENKSMQWGDCP